MRSAAALETKQNKNMGIVVLVLLRVWVLTHELTVLVWIANFPESLCVRGLISRMVLQGGGSLVGGSQLIGGMTWNYGTTPSPLLPVHEKRSSLLLPSPLQENAMGTTTKQATKSPPQ